MNAIFVGEKRSGKTTLAFDIAEKESGGVIVVDFKKEFKGWPATVSSVEQLEKAIAEKHRIIIWRVPDNKFADDSFDELADWIIAKHALALELGWDNTGANFTLLVDEAYNLQSHAHINAKLMKILSECRPEILNVFQTFQSVKNVNSDSRSRVSDWFIFTITLPGDLKRLEEFAMPEVIATVPTLDEHEYVHFLNEKGKTSFEIVTDSEEWNRSLEFTPEQESEEKIMSRDNWEPVSFETEEDFWDFVSKRDRRKEAKGKGPNGERERASDRSERRGGGNRGGNRGGGNGGFTVYKKSA